jgi:hypothetical protein
VKAEKLKCFCTEDKNQLGNLLVYRNGYFQYVQTLVSIGVGCISVSKMQPLFLLQDALQRPDQHFLISRVMEEGLSIWQVNILRERHGITMYLNFGRL